MFHYIFQIVPNSSNYDTNPVNVQKEYKIDRKCSITFFKLGYVKVTLIMLAQKIMVTMNRAHTCTNSLKLFPSMTQLLLEFCI
jgi:hypothetical protein